MLCQRAALLGKARWRLAPEIHKGYMLWNKKLVIERDARDTAGGRLQQNVGGIISPCQSLSRVPEATNRCNMNQYKSWMVKESGRVEFCVVSTRWCSTRAPSCTCLPCQLQWWPHPPAVVQRRATLWRLEARKRSKQLPQTSISARRAREVVSQRTISETKKTNGPIKMV